MKVTITEALAELKVVDKRIQKKREFVNNYLLRQEALKDPLEKDGGSVTAIQAALQAIDDLEDRIIRIRRQINIANIETKITVGTYTKSVADWLIWRREAAPKRQVFLTEVSRKIENYRAQTISRGNQVVTPGTPDAKPFDLIVNINEKQLAKWREDLEVVLETLDGQLSLKNATVTIEVE